MENNDTVYLSDYQEAELMYALTRLESAYPNHVKEYGKVKDEDVVMWSEQLKNVRPNDIRAAFLNHISTAGHWPKPVEILELVRMPTGRFARDDWANRDHLLLPEPVRHRIVPSNMTDDLKTRFDVLMAELVNDPVTRRRRAKDALRQVARQGRQVRNPMFGQRHRQTNKIAATNELVPDVSPAPITTSPQNVLGHLRSFADPDKQPQPESRPAPAISSQDYRNLPQVNIPRATP